jgi:uncharacterized protein YlxP (DUF503 family)
MVVGVCRLTLSIPENADLKGKRSVVKRIIARTRQQFNLAMAEVDDQDIWQSAVLGFCVVGNDHRFVNSVIDKVIVFIDELYLAEIDDHAIEILHVL